MDKKFLSSLDHDLSYRPGIIMEALECGVEFGSKEFFVYAQLRYWETDGKFGICVAGAESISESIGITPKEVTDALDRLKKKGLVQHVWCDKRVYRNKTKVWVSTVRLSQVCTNVDAIKVLKDGKKNLKMLGKTTCENVETTCENVVASPVTTGVGNTNKILINNASFTANAVSDASPKETEFPFDEDVMVDVRKKKSDYANVKSRRAFAIAGKVYKLMGLDAKPGVKMRNRIASRLDEGYTEEDIIGCIAWCEKDDYYGDNKDPMSWTSEDAMTKFKLNKETKKERPANDGAGMEVIW